MYRKTLLLVVSVYVAVSTLPCRIGVARGQDVNSDGQTGYKIVEVDTDRLANAAIPGCVPLDVFPRFDGAGVVHEYHELNSEHNVQIRISLFENAAARLSARALIAQMPMAGVTLPPIQSERSKTAFPYGFIHASGCVISSQNALVSIRFDRVRPKSASQDVWAAVYSALSDPTIARRGTTVNTPRLSVRSVTRVAWLSHAPDPAGYEVILESAAGGELLFHTWSWGRAQAEHLKPTTYKVRGSAYTTLGGVMEICAARPTGEVCVLDVKDMVMAADRVEVTWIKRDMGKRLNDANRAEFIEKLRRGEDAEEIARRSGLSADEIARRRWSGDDPAFPPPRAGTLDDLTQGMICEALAQKPTPECAPLFLDVLNGSRPDSVKQSALRGLAVLLGAGGLEHYRRIATDATQPFELRSEAVILIREFGSKQDIPLLRRIAEENPVPPTHGAKLAEFVDSAVERLTVKDRVVPGDQPN